MATLEERIRTAALAFPALSALLSDGGSPPLFRWYTVQLVQGTAFPAVVQMLVAGTPIYAAGGRLPTGYNRFQFTIWDTDEARAQQVERALEAFLEQLDLINTPGLIAYPCQVVLKRAALYPRPEPAKWQRIIDARIFANDDT